MAVSWITVDEVRADIGNPPKDPTEAGSVTDAELQAIIDRHKANGEEIIRGRVQQAAVSGQAPVADDEAFEEVTVALSPNGPLAEGTFDESTYYPFTGQHAWDDADKFYAYERRIQEHVNSFFARRRYRLIDDKVQVIPKDTTSITLYLPNKQKTNDRMGAEVVESLNKEIIKEALGLKNAKTQEGQRLEGTDYYGQDHDQ